MYRPTLQLKTSQQMLITPRMIQTLKLLQSSTPELIETIQHELSDNPFLLELTGEEATPDISSEAVEAEDEVSYQKEYSDLGSETGSPLKEHSDTTQIIEQTATKDIGLIEVLTDQLGLAFHEDTDAYKMGEQIIGSIDDNGYLPEKIELELISELEFDRETFENTLEVIRNFDPPGIASRDLKACLLKQLDLLTDLDTELERELVEEHLHELRPKKYVELAKKCDVTLEEIEQAAHTISLLEPKPSRKYRRLDNPMIYPDVSVKRVDDELQLSINDEVFPKIVLNDEYRVYLKNKENPEFKKYLLEKEEKAMMLLDAIRFRKKNIQKVVEKLMELQVDFFHKGPTALRPLTLVKLSEEIGINQGTLSRIVNSKYINTEWGTFPLRLFFSSSVDSTEGEVSSNKIKIAIQEILQTFGPDEHLSDQKITEALSKKGFKIARRTVAKYRSSLKILSSFHR